MKGQNHIYRTVSISFLDAGKKKSVHLYLSFDLLLWPSLNSEPLEPSSECDTDTTAKSVCDLGRPETIQSPENRSFGDPE